MTLSAADQSDAQVAHWSVRLLKGRMIRSRNAKPRAVELPAADVCPPLSYLTLRNSEIRLACTSPGCPPQAVRV